MIDYTAVNFISKCCGCQACIQVCKHHAIVFKENDEGFFYPHINEEECVNCGLCNIVCPILHAEETVNSNINVYAAISKDKTALKESSSGGVFSIIAKYVLKKGGIVYGAAFDKNLKLSHVGIEKLSDLTKLQGSKYLQSDLTNVYSLVKDQLKNSRWVYFTGTPCQIAGLKCFLRKPYSTLITSDLICHGVPSQKIFSTCVEHLEKKKEGRVEKYSFRDKKVGGWSCCSSSHIRISKEKSIYVKRDANMDAYFNAFIRGDLMRYVCYECPFARKERTGDITLADYWGINKYHPEIKSINQGVSMILVNTFLGESIFNECKHLMELYSSKIEYALEANPNLRLTTSENVGRKESYTLAFYQYDNFIAKYVINRGFLKNLRFYVWIWLREHEFVLDALRFLKRKVK